MTYFLMGTNEIDNMFSLNAVVVTNPCSFAFDCVIFWMRLSN